MTEEGEAEAKLFPDPFMIFVEEIWENILSELEDSKDILNVFKAFPDLEGRVLKNKYGWLIDQVYEHLSLWLARKDELACRQVSRRWCRAVDTDMDKYHVPVVLDKTDDMSSFLQKMGSHPPSRTPFVGRSVMIDDLGASIEGEYYDQPLHWTGAKEIFRRFGGHVSFLELRIAMEDTVQFCQIVLEVLRCVPNLKSLRLGQFGGDYSDEAHEFVEGQLNLFPALPQLETMDFTGNNASTPESLIVHLLRRYSPQIRTLGLNLDLFYWRQEYSYLFPKLEHLNPCGFISFEEVTDIIHSLNAPDLKKLDLELKYGGKGAVEKNIVSWLEDLPLIQHLGIVILHVGETVGDNLPFPIPTTRNIPTLKNLAIQGAVDEIDFSFLECFPSLEFLKVCPYYGPSKYFGRRNLYDPEIWEMLPKLQVLYVSKRELRALPRYFSRAKYDWLKERKERRMSGPPDVECLMNSFDSMVSDNWEVDDGEGALEEEKDVQ